MTDYTDILQYDPFTVPQNEKNDILTQNLLELTGHHKEHCQPYRRILETIGFDMMQVDSYDKIPFLPVRLFKELELMSIERADVFKIMTSSGTTGQLVSKIFLDKNTAANQQKTLVKIVSDFTQGSRMPMIIIDCPSVIKNRAMFSARGAGILGFSIFGRHKIYALNDDMELEVDKIQEFIAQNKGKKILLFGFTFMVWQHFYKALKSCKKSLDLSNAILIHGGGWKKMAQEAVSPVEFNQSLKNICGIPQICNYYGMVEQTGCIYMECEYGHLHASTYSDIIMRRGLDFQPCNIGEKGIVQVVSMLPESYPGHSLLTEDEGIVLGIDDCPCGRKGKYFQILGRLKNAEIRGCSDTYATKF